MRPEITLAEASAWLAVVKQATVSPEGRRTNG
jgi:hypothetical protein